MDSKRISQDHPASGDDVAANLTKKAKLLPMDSSYQTVDISEVVDGLPRKTEAASRPLALSRTVDPTTSSSIRAASRKNRVYVFREFVINRYGDYLKEGDTVLDIAGGKGDLSWLLSNVDNLNSVVVDPRLTRNHIVKSVQYLREHPDQAQKRAIPNLPTYQPLAGLLSKLESKDNFVSPRHLRVLVDHALVNALTEYQRSNSMASWSKYWEEATRKGRDTHMLGYKETHTNDGKEIQASNEALNIILETKLILGFHPDQATDPALDLAKVLGIPYCIVPCCVFPKEFKLRRTPEGNLVRTYSELLQYLRHKYAMGMNEAKLPFHFTETAKNIVLYTVPPTKSHQNDV